MSNEYTDKEALRDAVEFWEAILHVVKFWGTISPVVKNKDIKLSMFDAKSLARIHLNNKFPKWYNDCSYCEHLNKSFGSTSEANCEKHCLGLIHGVFGKDEHDNNIPCYHINSSYTALCDSMTNMNPKLIEWQLNNMKEAYKND